VLGLDGNQPKYPLERVKIRIKKTVICCSAERRGRTIKRGMGDRRKGIAAHRWGVRGRGPHPLRTHFFPERRSCLLGKKAGEGAYAPGSIGTLRLGLLPSPSSTRGVSLSGSSIRAIRARESGTPGALE